MTKEQLKEKVETIIVQPQVRPALKEAGQAWLIDSSAANGQKLVAAAKANIALIDETIAFFESDDAKQIFGEETAAGMLAHAKAIKAEGAKFCDCSACNPTLVIIENEAVLPK